MTDFADVIYAYTRADAIEDGILVDVSETAREAGFKYPVALTHAVCTRYVELPEDESAAAWQDVDGRLWDVLWMLLVQIRRTQGAENPTHYELVVNNGNAELTENEHWEGESRLVKLKALCGPGDTVEPVITIMLPHED